MHAKRPEGPALSGQRPPLPARAMPAQVKPASPADPVYPVRRTDRGPAPITGLIHLPPPAVRCRVQVRQLHLLITHHVNLVSRPGRSCGHRVPPPGPELACGAGRHHRTWATERSGGRLPGPAYHASTIRVSLSTDTEPPLPCQIQAGSPMRGPRSKTARNPSKRALPARLNPELPPGRASSSRQMRTFAPRMAMYKYTGQAII
jgi:hypothetical protein